MNDEPDPRINAGVVGALSGKHVSPKCGCELGLPRKLGSLKLTFGQVGELAIGTIELRTGWWRVIGGESNGGWRLEEEVPDVLRLINVDVNDVVYF